MAINPGIVQGLQPMRSPLEREQRLMSLKNARLGQEQEETALESAQLQNQGTRQKFDAEGALKKVLAENPEAPDSELYRVAGPYAQPVIAQRRLEKKAKLEDQKAQFDMHAQMVNELGNGAFGIRQLSPEQRKPAHDVLIQRMLQSGLIDEEAANDLLDDDLSDSGLDQVIATTPALKLQLEQAQKKVQNDLANVVKEIDTYTNAQGRRTTLFQKPDGSTFEHVGGEVQKPERVQVPGVDIPFPREVENQRTRMAGSSRNEPQEPLVSVIGDDGQPVYLPRSQAVGRRPAGTREQGRPVTSGDANRVAEFNTSLDDVDVLTQAISAAGDTGTLAKMQAWAPNWVTEITGGWGEDAKSRQAVIDRVKQVIGKALEGGVLRKEDEYKYEKILPTIGDPKGLVDSKLKDLGAAITKRRTTHLEALEDAGYDTSKFRARGPGGGGGGPKVGDIQDGYQFLGGDPSNPQSWKKVP